MDVEQRLARQDHAQVLEGKEEPGKERPERAAEQELRDQGETGDRKCAGDRRPDPPSEGVHPERLDSERDRPLAERRMDERADIPFLFAERALVPRLDLAHPIGAADEDARGLRVVVLVEDQRRRVGQAQHPDERGDRGDREDRDPRPVQALEGRRLAEMGHTGRRTQVCRVVGLQRGRSFRR